MSRWHYAKMHIAALDDVKLSRLSDNLWRRFWEMVLIARESGDDGTTIAFEDILWRLRLRDEASLACELDELTRLGFLAQVAGEDRWSVVNFARYQGRSANAERQSAYRERQRDEARAARRVDAAQDYRDVVVDSVVAQAPNGTISTHDVAALSKANSDVLFWWLERVRSRLPAQEEVRRIDYLLPVDALMRHSSINYDVERAKTALEEKHNRMLAAGYTPKRPKAIIDVLLSELDAPTTGASADAQKQARQRAATKSAVAQALDELQ